MMLSLITDDVALAVEAERAGIDRVMIDLEREGKAQRQAGRNLFQSTHSLESVARVKAVLHRAAMIVRINPLSERTPQEIDDVVASGADVIMLPYFFTPDEVRTFVALVGGRSQVSLLVETRSAVECLPECLAAGGIDEVHVGLNDLSIDLGCTVLLEPLCTGVVDRIVAVLRASGVPFGIGGLARLSCGTLPVCPERLLAEQVRLGCRRAWLGRTFRDGLPVSGLALEVARIREAVARWEVASLAEWEANRFLLVEEVLRWKARVLGVDGVESEGVGA
jgi:2-keto-3-deoxy-L-rhamnonate aldolase RhmA